MALGMREVSDQMKCQKLNNTRMLFQVSQKEYDNWKGGWDAAGVLLKGREEALDA